MYLLLIVLEILFYPRTSSMYQLCHHGVRLALNTWQINSFLLNNKT